jgi:hypothetical protein
VSVSKFKTDEAFGFRVTYQNGFSKHALFATEQERDEVAENLIKTIDEEPTSFVSLNPSYDEEDTVEVWERTILTDRPKKVVVKRDGVDWSIDVDGVLKKYRDEKTFLTVYQKVLRFVKSFDSRP